MMLLSICKLNPHHKYPTSLQPSLSATAQIAKRSEQNFDVSVILSYKLYDVMEISAMMLGVWLMGSIVERLEF